MGLFYFMILTDGQNLSPASEAFFISWFCLQIACNDTFTSCVQQTEISPK